MLKVINLSKNYNDKKVLKNVSFEMKKGEVISIIGSSGSGKSTLLRCINKLENYDGKILFNNKDICEIDSSLLRQKIGLVFQNYNLFENLTVLENLTIGLTKIKKVDTDVANKDSMKMLNDIGLVDKANNYPDELSGGQCQRIAIARALLMKPTILMLDEPTSALDRQNKEEVKKILTEMVNRDLSLIIVSHDEKFVEEISDSIYDLKNGKLENITRRLK